jgi:trimethylamine--corrinoid protein Co-methyltransferase
MGFSGPVTAAGYQAMGAAGQLAALVLAQLIREGTPFVVRGGRIVVADMKSMLFTFADPGNRVFSAQMARHYDLPSFGTAGCSDSKRVDFQAVAEASLTLLADALAGASLIHDVGYIESGVTCSAQMMVLCDEIIHWIRAFRRGAPVSEDTLALAEVDRLGLGGDFLTDDHTLRHYREQWEARGIFDRDPYHTWLEEGSSDIAGRIADRIEQILSEHRCRSLPEGTRRELGEIARHGVAG